MNEGIIEGFGFNRRERDPSKLENSCGTEIRRDKVPKSLEPFLDFFIEMFIGGNSISGVYRGMDNDGAHIFCPTTFPNPEKYFNKEAPPTERNIWRDRPTILYGHIEGFRSLDKETLESYAGNFSEVAHLGRIYGVGEENEKQLRLFE